MKVFFEGKPRKRKASIKINSPFSCAARLCLGGSRPCWFWKMKKLELEMAQLRNLLGLAVSPSLKWICKSKSKFSSLSREALESALKERQAQRLEEHLFAVQRDLKRTLKKVATLDALNSSKKGKESRLKHLDLDVESDKLMCKLKRECGIEERAGSTRKIREKETESTTEKETESDPSSVTQECVSANETCNEVNLDSFTLSKIPQDSLFASASAYCKWKKEALNQLKTFLSHLHDSTAKEEQEQKIRQKRKAKEEQNTQKRQFTLNAAASQPQPKEKKNRPGQRARRLEWERLHGKDANHLKVEEEEKPADKKELHPSWIAKLAQQQKASEANFAGKKVVFQDDDNDE